MNNLNYGIQIGNQANLNRKKSSKAQKMVSKSPSFGMKMNNRQVSQKDTVSFGVPEWWDKIDSAARKTAAVVLMPELFIGIGMVEAAIGEANVTGADVPFLCATEMMMFNLLTDALDADPTAALIHAGKHMASAGVVGMRILNKAISAFGWGAHIAAFLATGGIGNVGVSAAIRATNGALSAGCCETMGWAFVKDYKNGKMNVEDKILQVIGSIAFHKLTDLFDGSFDLEEPAFDLQETSGKTLGKALVQNMPKGMGEFLQEATKKVADSGLAPFAEKALELTIPRVTQKIIETKGEVSSEEIENIIVGSALGVACSDILGDTSYLSKETIQRQAIPIMKTLKSSPAITNIVNDALIKHGIKRYGDITLNRDMANLLEEFYNSVIPKIKDTYKTIKNL